MAQFTKLLGKNATKVLEEIGKVDFESSNG